MLAVTLRNNFPWARLENMHMKTQKLLRCHVGELWTKKEEMFHIVSKEENMYK